MSSSQYSSNAHVIGKSPQGFNSNRRSDINVASPTNDSNRKVDLPADVTDYNSKTVPKSTVNKASTSINFRMNNVGQQALGTRNNSDLANTQENIPDHRRNKTQTDKNNVAPSN
jgi:hypothetical protein